MRVVPDQEDFKFTFDSQTKAIGWLALLTMFLSLELIAFLALVYSFIPFKLDPMVYKMFPLFLDQIRPEREMRFFMIFIAFNVFMQGASLFIFHRKMNDEQWVGKLRKFVGVEALWVFLIAFAAFKIFVYGDPLWARVLLWMSLASSVITKIFWPEVCASASWVERQLQACQGKKKVRLGLDALVIVFIVFIIFIPDTSKVLGRIYAWDQFYHIDMFVMSSALAHVTGNILNVDVISLYSVLLSILVGNIMKWMGGLNYESLLNIFMYMTILYYISSYALLRVWTRSLVLATFSVLLMIKLQMFHIGILPIIWRYPSTLPVRHLLDILTIWALLRHTQTEDRKYLYTAAVGCGIMIAYMIDVGINLTLGFYAYLFMLAVIPHCREKFFKTRKDWIQCGALGVIPFLSALMILLLTQGPSILSQTFWAGFMDFLSIFLNGWGSLPMTDGLKENQFFAFVMGFVIPAVYVWTLILAGVLCFLKQIRWQNIFIIFMSVYGLAMYHYFMGRSATSSYYVVVVPFIFVVCFWLKEIRARIPQAYKTGADIVLVSAMTGALLTSYLFTFYPNAMNLAGFDFNPEKKIYQAQFDFSRDAQLIERLTASDDRVALLSSFETKILIQAKRGPFFYYFPMINSVAMDLNYFRGTEMYTRPRMKRTLDQLEQTKPEYIFVEKRLIRRQLSPEFFVKFETLRILLEYVDEHYKEHEEGHYLVAMKREVVSQ